MPTPGGPQCGVLMKLSDMECEGECCFAACRKVTLFWSGKISLFFSGENNGAPDTIRTCDLPLRRGTLYPAELRGRGADSTCCQ